MRLKGKRIVVTGSSQGFGLAAAEEFVNQGSHVIMCARDAKMLYKAREKVAQKAKGKVKVIAKPADVSKVEDVERLFATAFDEFEGVEVLLCNAGVYGPKGPIEELDWNAWQRSVEINIMGTFLPCRAILPHMKNQRKGKIIIMSGGGATKPLPFLSAYAASKAALVRFTETLAEEVQDFGIDVNAVAPGALNTRMLDEVLEAGPKLVGDNFYQQMMKIKEEGGTPFEVGVSLCVFLASSESDGITGKLISAVWDPWHELPERSGDLKGTDIFTLRRIIPRDRGKNWG